MKFVIIIATLGLATFVVLRRRNPELAERVEGAVKDAAAHVNVNEDTPGDLAARVRDKAKDLAS
jgi:hypothetical protein